MDKIKALRDKLNAIINDIKDVKSGLQAAYNEVFASSPVVKAIIDKIECGNPDGYQRDASGDIEAYYKIGTLTEFSEEPRPYFEEYLADRVCAHVDWDNDAAIVWLGDDNLCIQDDSRNVRDNGVWQGHKMIIKETEYREYDFVNDCTGDVDEVKRNALIEAHMERTGCYPNVFHVTQYGDVYCVDTRSPEAKAAKA